MAVPSFVPVAPTHEPRDYKSAPRRMDPWMVDRPGDFADHARQPDPDTARLGTPGPDQGYAVKLARIIAPELHLSESENPRDVEIGLVAVALKRASMFGRAPVIHDLRMAATVWGFMDPNAPDELVAERTGRFEGLRFVLHHYPELREVVDAVSSETLALTPDQLTDEHSRDWRALLDLS